MNDERSSNNQEPQQPVPGDWSWIGNAWRKSKQSGDYISWTWTGREDLVLPPGAIIITRALEKTKEGEADYQFTARIPTPQDENRTGTYEARQPIPGRWSTIGGAWHREGKVEDYMLWRWTGREPLCLKPGSTINVARSKYTGENKPEYYLRCLIPHDESEGEGESPPTSDRKGHRGNLLGPRHDEASTRDRRHDTGYDDLPPSNTHRGEPTYDDRPYEPAYDDHPPRGEHRGPGPAYDDRSAHEPAYDDRPPRGHETPYEPTYDDRPPREQHRSGPAYDDRPPREQHRSGPAYDDRPPREQHRSGPTYDDRPPREQHRPGSTYDDRPPREQPPQHPDTRNDERRHAGNAPHDDPRRVNEYGPTDRTPDEERTSGTGRRNTDPFDDDIPW